MQSPDAVLDFRVPSEPHLSRVVREAVSVFAGTHGIFGDTLDHFLSALGEALANAMEHARSEKPIEVEVRIGGEMIVATVRDQGIGFAAERAVEPALPDPHAERGRGLPIMRRCCDVFAVESTPGSGTSVRIGCHIRTSSVASGNIADPNHAA